MLSKGRFLVRSVALVLWAVIALLPGVGGAGRSIVVSGSQPMPTVPLLAVAEAADGLPDEAPAQTDNQTGPVSSGGAVSATFTVISPPGSDGGGHGISTTGHPVNDPEGTAAIMSPQEVGRLDGDDRLTCEVSDCTAGVSQTPDGSTWDPALLCAICSVEAAALACLSALVWGPRRQVRPDE